MGSTGNPGGEPSLTPRPSDAVTQARRGAEGRSRHARHLPSSARFVPRAVPVTLPAGGVADGQTPAPRRRWCWTALPRCTACGSARRRRATPCRTCGDRWWPGHGWPGITSSGTAAGGPWWGAGPPAATAPAQGTAARRLGPDPGPAQAANRPVGSDCAHCLPGPQPRAGRRGHVGEPGRGSDAASTRPVSATGRHAFNPEYQPHRERQRSPVRKASGAAARNPTREPSRSRAAVAKAAA
jgi:hypothetical protein